MNLSSRRSPSALYKQESQTLLQSRTNAFMQTLNQSASHSRLQKMMQTQDIHSVIEKLMQTRDFPSLPKIPSATYLRAKRYLLAQTQDRIFAEVIGLLEELDELSSSMIENSQQIRELKIQYPHIEQLVTFHGYQQKLTYQQCSDLQEENLQLARKIEEIQSKQINGLEEVLRIERQKYEELKIELSDSRASNLKSIQDRITDLKNSIAQLEKSRNAKLKAHYPEFESLQQSNEQLRQKTIINLRSKTESQQQAEMRQYLAEQQQNRLEFMSELRNFKAEFNRLRAQNEELKEKLSRRRRMDSKQNSNIQNRSKGYSNKQLQVESYIRKGSNKFSQYESVIKMMQSVNK